MPKRKSQGNEGSEREGTGNVNDSVGTKSEKKEARKGDEGA